MIRQITVNSANNCSIEAQDTQRYRKSTILANWRVNDDGGNSARNQEDFK